MLIFQITVTFWNKKSFKDFSSKNLLWLKPIHNHYWLLPLSTIAPPHFQGLDLPFSDASVQLSALSQDSLLKVGAGSVNQHCHRLTLHSKSFHPNDLQ